MPPVRDTFNHLSRFAQPLHSDCEEAVSEEARAAWDAVDWNVAEQAPTLAREEAHAALGGIAHGDGAVGKRDDGRRLLEERAVAAAGGGAVLGANVPAYAHKAPVHAPVTLPTP